MTACPFISSHSSAFDDESRTHGGPLAAERQRTVAAPNLAFNMVRVISEVRGVLRARQARASTSGTSDSRLVEPSLLQILVLQPAERMEIVLRRRQTFSFREIDRRCHATSSDCDASSHMPSGRNTCDGMCWAWLDAGAILA